MSRPTQIDIHLQAIRDNCALAQQLCPQSKTVAVVKADAYGHGALEVALALEPQVQMLTVSSLEEAMALRDGGITKPILLLEGVFCSDELALAAKHELQLVVHHQQQVAELLASCTKYRFTIWLKVDSGMHRLGVTPEQMVAIYSKLEGCSQVSKIILTTHLASADDQDSVFTKQQLACFTETIRPITENSKSTSLEASEQSIANSAGIMAWPKSHVQWIRPGIMLYGLSPFSHSQVHADRLVPSMTFRSQIIALRKISKGECVGYGNTWCADKDSLIATVAAGYGDGYPRNAKSGTPVLVNGERAALAGRVSMDMIGVDVSALPSVSIGDEVVLWGRAHNNEVLSANEVATWADTIAYELVTRMPRRAPRNYIDL